MTRGVTKTCKLSSMVFVWWRRLVDHRWWRVVDCGWWGVVSGGRWCRVVGWWSWLGHLSLCYLNLVVVVVVVVVGFDERGFGSTDNLRRNQTVGDFRSSGGSGGMPARSRSTEDIYTRAQLEASAAGKEGFFARKMAENESRPEGLPPSQGGKYVGFGSTPNPVPRPSSQQGNVLSSVTQGLGKLSIVAASAAQSAASVVQAGTKELTTKVRDGGYDYKVNETVNVVTAKTTEIGQKTWGLMKGVMAFASQKVEEYAKENPTWKSDSWQRNETQGNGFYQEFGHSNGVSNPVQSSGGNGTSVSSSGRNSNSVDSGSWDDWDNDGYRKPASTTGTTPSNNGGDDWAGWDDAKDDGYDSFYKSDGKTTTHTNKSNGNWSGAGFL